MIEIPSDLNPGLVPLAFLLGTWQGAGVAALDKFGGPDAEACNFGQEVTFSHDGRDFLEFSSRTWRLDADGKRLDPLETEHGYWRIKDRQLEVVMVRDQGVAEVWYGELAEGKPQIDLATDAVARTAVSPPYTGGKRLYGYVNGDLMWVGEKATPDVPLQAYMSAHLKKAVDPRLGAPPSPEGWGRVADIKDLPDDGIAFFR
ncbi:FABP family protein [Streptomyces litchfieldiae]|uniref:Ferric nitrobindin-like protein n=1 Tax=Streptomyces litchfieldiae TaxID=3075543 RepID=A0ABU2MPC7_9ACTN|nr:FABP family protein [Streptomyces sp. DSM 44938]MDT0343365.1 FABP family protein [Streptomyces sp. DSM 44938]